MAFENRKQITKYQNKDKVLEFNNNLAIAPVENAANLHAGYSKIHIVIVDTSKGKGKDAIVTEANVDPVKMKRLYEKVSALKTDGAGATGATASPAAETAGGTELTIGLGDYKAMTPTEALLQNGAEAATSLEKLLPVLEKNADKYVINKRKMAEIKAAIEKFRSGALKQAEPVEGAPVAAPTMASTTLLYEKKINPSEKRKNDRNEYPVTVLNIEYNPRMRNCWTVSMENGWAEKEMQKMGGTAIKGGTYRKEKETKVAVDEEKFREIVRQVNDFIMLKEARFMAVLDEKLEELEAKEAAERAASRE